MPTPEDQEFELKYELRAGREAVLQSVLGQRCEPDPVYPESFVSSVYFDTRDFVSLHEKINSDYLKSKVRLRWYEAEGSPQGERSFVEVKQKVGSQRIKRRLPAPLPASRLMAEPLDSAAFELVLDVLREAGIATHGPLEPVLTLRYRRRRYRDGATGCRLSLDTEISVPWFNPRVVSPADSTRPPTAVVEVKSSTPDLPPSLHFLVDLGCRLISLSKYAICLQRLRPLRR